MNSCVCVKQVPDTAEIRIDPERHTLVRAGVPSILNPFDAYALEAAVRLKEQKGGKVTVISMGPVQAQEMLKECLAVGADEAYLISGKGFCGSDTLATSYALSRAIRTVEARTGIEFDLILCGKQAIDGDTAQVGPALAEHLGIPQVTCALDVCVEKSRKELLVKRECEMGYDRIAVRLPAVVTVTRIPYEPRFPTIRTKLAAKKREIPVLAESDLSELVFERCGFSGSPTKVKTTYPVMRKKKGVIWRGLSPEEAAEKLVELLPISEKEKNGGE